MGLQILTGSSIYQFCSYQSITYVHMTALYFKAFSALLHNFFQNPLLCLFFNHMVQSLKNNLMLIENLH